MKYQEFFLIFLLTVSFVNVAFANPLKQEYGEGVLAFHQQNYKSAIEHFERCTDMLPEFAPAYYYLGMSHRKLGSKPQRVIWLLEKAIKFDSTHEKAYEELSKIYYEMAQFDKAEEAGLKALEINPNNLVATLSLGWVYLLGKGEAQEAVSYFEKALKTQETIAYAQLGLGIAYHMSDQRFKALEAITNLRQLGEDNLAVQLEAMVREGSTGRSIPGQPLLVRSKERSQLIQNAPPSNYPTITGNKAVEKMPVRLSGAMPSGFNTH